MPIKLAAKANTGLEISNLPRKIYIIREDSGILILVKI